LFHCSIFLIIGDWLYFYRVSVLVKLLQAEGFQAAATHFDQRGAVRTNAPYNHISHLLTERFSQK